MVAISATCGKCCFGKRGEVSVFRRATIPISRYGVAVSSSIGIARVYKTFYEPDRSSNYIEKKTVNLKRYRAPSNPIYHDVGKWIKLHYEPYDGDDTFLSPPTARTKAMVKTIAEASKQEVEAGGVLDVDPSTPSTITAFPPGYIDKENELIVGLQTDKLLKRAIKPQGGVNIVRNALEAYGYEMDPDVEREYTEVRKTQNQGIFDIYTDEMRKARKSGILTGLPDGYGRGRIIGDYRRVALYGVDALIEERKNILSNDLTFLDMTEDVMRLREEIVEHIKALEDLKAMARTYGFDISESAKCAKDAIQWTYFAYLAAVKQQDGAAMSLGRVDAFFDIYIERDMKIGFITESDAQELIDDFVLKLRVVKQLRTPEYNELFAGDPTWVTMAIGGATEDGCHMVTKTTYRILRTLRNLKSAPEPNITVLWNNKVLPENFKKFCAKVSIDTSSIQYENDALMNPVFGSDYAISCCVSAMRQGKDMQYFGARCNLPKLLLYCINDGRDEVSGVQVGPKFGKSSEVRSLNFSEVCTKFDKAMDWLARLYANTMNVIHYAHDKYNYESLQMALHDVDVRRFMAFGVCGLSCVVDSLSAIKHAKVYPVIDHRRLATSFRVDGKFPCYGNDDDGVDDIAMWILNTFTQKLNEYLTYRESIPTLSVLTITSNTVYGRKTGSTPDGRKFGEPFAAGANAMHGREAKGALASLNTISKLNYEDCFDGISNTFTLVPSVLGKGEYEQVNNLSALIDGYMDSGGHHINVNVLFKKKLLEAIDNPDMYPNLTVRISGYAVSFVKLPRDKQMEFIARTFHETM